MTRRMAHPVPVRSRLSRFLLTLAAVGALTNCGTGSAEEIADDKADGRDPLYESDGYKKNPMLVAFQPPFDMCFSNPERTDNLAGFGVDLNTAKWLSWFSANEYAHYAHAAPVFEEMGFGDVGEGQKWVDAGRRIMRTRAQEQTGEKSLGTAALIEQDVVQRVIPGKKIQFFSAGHIEDKMFIDDSTQVTWVQHRTEPVVILAFRGTEGDEISDILSDLNIIKVDRDGYGSIHGGFANAYSQIEDMLKQKLEAESGQNLKIWVTGHSLGGALASLATTTIMDHIKTDPSYSLQGLYTFGKPRVGDAKYVDTVEAGYARSGTTALRFRNGDDIVTQVPWNIIGFYHAGHLMHMNAEGYLNYNPGRRDVGDTSSHEGPFDDHSIASQYNARIIQHLESGNYRELSRKCPPTSN